MEMIMNNENKNSSRNRKRRIEERKKINDDMKFLSNKIKSEKKKNNKNNDKTKQLEILLVRIKYADKADELESALRELTKIQVIKKKLHEYKHEKLLHYVGEFEMVGYLNVSDQIRETHIRFRNISDYEAYINTIDND